MKSLLRRILGKTRAPKSATSNSDQANPPNVELENLEPRMLFSAAPVETPNEGDPEVQAAEESVVVSQQAASIAALALEGAEMEADDPDGTLAAEHSLKLAEVETELTAFDALQGADGATDLSAEQNVTLVNVDGVSAGLNQATLDAVAEAARQRWLDSGQLSGEQVAALDNITYEIDHLPAARLGSVNGNTISIDGDAWGKGWYIDATPLDDGEFSTTLGSGALSANGGLGGRYDLLTAVLHEQGHLLGLIDLNSAGSATGNVMSKALSAELRLLPATGQAAGAVPGSVEGPEFLGMTFTVSNLADSGAGSLRQAVSDANTLAGADFIEFTGGGVGTINTSTQLTITDDVIINNNNAAGVVINNIGANNRVFEVQNDAVTFQDLTISGGFLTGSHGAGLYNNNGQITLTNVVIDNNQTSGSGADRHGGGIWNNGANATLTGTNVDFTSNKAARTAGGNAVGGGLWATNGSTTNLTDVTFTGNEAREGGGFYLSGGFGDTVTLTNATIDSNKTLVRGAGFRNSGVDTVVTINGGTINGNIADYEHGGGFHNSGKVVLTDVDITNNQVLDFDNTNGRFDDSYGGGFYNNPSSFELPNAGIVEIKGGSITDNVAFGHGGGFWNRGGIVTIDGTSGDPVEIYRNEAGAAGTNGDTDGKGGDTRNGGGFFASDGAETALTWVNFDDGTLATVNTVTSINQSNDYDDLRGVGAGFYNSSQSSVTLDNVSITNHRSTSGGAFYQDGTLSQVIGTNVTIDNNTARVNGGGFRNASTGGIVTLTDSSIDGNIARLENGGGFYNAGTVNLDNTDVENGQALDLDNANRRDSHGGGFYNGGGIVNLTNGSDVLNNISYGDGAGFRNSGGVVNMSDGIIDGNSIVMFSTATQHGGGFWNQGDAVANLVNVIISNNETGKDTPLGPIGGDDTVSAGTRTRGVGGGFWNTDGSVVNISGDSQIIGNRSEGGGGFYNTSTGSIVNITGTKANPIEIDGNSSRGVGGGFQNTGNTITNLDWVEITNNTTDGGRGGGFYNDGAQVTGTNLKINDNKTGFLGRSGDEQGGGFWNSGNGLTDLTDSEVNNNFSFVHGGAGYNEGGTITLTRVTAEGNFANNSGGGFFINNSSVLNLTDSSISDNIARDHGGGFWTEDDSKVTALRTNIDGNLAGYEQDGVTRRESGTAGIGSTPTGSDLRGGGFWASGRSIVTLTDSTVNDNETARHGGGGNLENETQLFLNGTTVANNVANNHGGGFRIASNAHLDAVNSTISGNYAGFGRANNGGAATADYDGRVGGGIWSQSGGNETILNHVTLTDNHATAGGSGAGAGIYRSSGFIQAENSILYGNIADAEQAPAGQDASDVRGAITLVGANVLGAHSTSGGGISGEVGNRITADPNLAPLADNGNPVVLPDGGTPQTHAITNTSVASGSAVNSTVAIDQVGNGRPGTSTATTPTDINVTGASLLTNPDFTELDRNATVSGSSIVYGAGTVDNEDLFDYVVLPEIGEFPLTGPITVTIDFTFTKVTGDQDYVFSLSNGGNTLTWNMNDNNGGDIIFGGSTIISDGEPALGVSTTATFEFVLDQNGSTLNATRNGFSGSNSVSTVLGPMNGLTFSARLGNAGEQTQVDNIAVTYTGLTGQTGGADVGAYEVDPLTTTLTIDDLTIPENAISGEAFDVEATATSTGAGPLTYSWTVDAPDGGTIGSGSGSSIALTATNPGTSPVQTVDVTVTVTDTTTNQTASATREVFLVDTMAMPTTFTAGSIVVDKIGDEVDGDLSAGEVTLREAINAANASGAGSYGITFAASIDTMPILASDQAKLNYDGQTVDFAAGEIVTGSNGAFGTVVTDTDNGVSGQLVLSGVTGTFANNNALTGSLGGAAVVNGTMFNNDNFGYDFDILKTNGAVFIVGNGTANTIVSGNNLDTVFDVRPNVTAYFKDLTITGGQTAFTDGNDEHGGGVRNQGATSIFQGTDITGNAAAINTGAVGGGIYTTSSGLNPGRIYMTGGSVANNTAQSSGGGIYLSGNNVGESILHLDGTVIDGNTASFGNTELDSRRGGGVYFTDDGNRLVFNNVTVSDNATDGRNASDGGGLAFAGADHTIEINGGSIIRNQAGDNLAGTGTSDSDGGGFWSATTRSTFDFTGVDIGGELAGGADAAGLGSARLNGNLAEDEGGGFYLEGRFNTYNLIDTRIIGNVGQDDGGGFMIINDTETVNISQTGADLGVIRNNLSTTSNGAGFRNDGIVNITGTAAIPLEIRYNEARGSVGGGFYTTSNGATTLTDVVVRNNQALNQGGGYYNSGGGHVIITSSTTSTSGVDASFVSKIIDNKNINATDGGGFYQTTSYSTSDLTDVLISGNKAGNDGGGFYQSSNLAEVNLTRVDITGNESQDNGGGFMNASNGSIVNLDTVLIDGNRSTTEHGGGFYSPGIVNGKTVTITNNKVGFDLDNKSTSTGDLVGGGFYSPGGLITLVDATIENNTARGRGGGFYNSSAGIVNISSDQIRSTISNNDVFANRNEGGGFWNGSAGSLVQLNGVDVNNNIATEGGAFYQESDNARIELTDVVVDSNVARTRGGAFWNTSSFSQVHLDDVEITNNSTEIAEGGGFRNQGQVTGQDVIISGNTTGTDDIAAKNDSNNIGGGFYNNGSAAVVELTRVEITDNFAYGRGGGWYSDGTSQVRLTDFIISGNKTDQNTSEGNARGAGFWNSGNADITLERGEISENESFGHGAGFYQRDTGSSVSATNVTISGNIAGIDQDSNSGSGFVDRVGGGFWVENVGSGQVIDLNHVTISDNRTTRSGTSAGAGFRTEGSVAVNLENSIVFGNLTDIDGTPTANNDIDNNSGGNLTVTGNNVIGVVSGAITSGNTGGISTADPVLGVLQDNSGTILPSGSAARTHALDATLSTSAVDQSLGSTVTEDQRGLVRTAPNDLGAFETGVTLNADELSTIIDNVIILRNVGGNAEVEIDGVIVLNTPLSSLSTLTINGQTGDDILTVDYTGSGGDPLPVGGLFYNGDDNTGGAKTYDDILVINGGAFATVAHDMTGPEDGALNLDGAGAPEITYTGLDTNAVEPAIDTTGSTIADLIFNLPAGADSAQLSDLGGGNLLLESLGGTTFESTRFANPSGSITINGGAGDTLVLGTAVDIGTTDFNVTGFDTISLDKNLNSGNQIWDGGTVNHTAGTNASSGTITLADNLDTIYNVNGGTVTVTTAILDGTGNSTINLESDTLGTGTTDITVDNFNINPLDAGLTNITYDRSGGTLQVNNNLVLGGDLNGSDADRGNVTQTGGIVNVGNDLLFGGAANTEGGTYNLDGGNLNVTGDIVEGASGAPDEDVDSAQLHIDGGALSVTGDITVQRFAIGQDAGQDGSYTAAAGQKITSTGTTSIGANAMGTLDLTAAGASLSSLNAIVGEGANGDGTVTIDNSNTWTATQNLRIGLNGTGLVNLNSGTLDILGTSVPPGLYGLYLGGASGDGTLNIGVSGGSGTADPTVNVSGGNTEVGSGADGIGVVTMHSGTFTQSTSNIVIGQAAGSDGLFTLNDGAVDIQVGDLNVSNSGKGTYTQNDGALDSTGISIGNIAGTVETGAFNLIDGTATTTDGFIVAASAGSNGIVQIGNTSGATPILNVSGGNFEVADVGTGVVTMDSGTLNVTSNNLIVGQAGTSDATFNFNGGLIDLQNQLRVGNTGKGLFDQSGGTINVGTILDIANNPGGTADGTYRMTGGILNAGDRAANNIIVGNVNDPGASALMEIIDGTVNASRSIRIADNGSDSSGTLIVGDGTTNPIINLNTVSTGNFETADNGTGTFTFRSGTISEGDNNLITGQAVGSEVTAVIGGFGSTATLEIQGSGTAGDWNTNGGHGIVSVLANGIVNVANDINMGNNGDANSGLELTINGGTVNVGTGTPGVGNITYRNLGDQDQINLMSGLLAGSGGTINLNDAPDSAFAFTGGTLQNFTSFLNASLTQSSADSASNLVIGEAGAGAGATMTIGGNYDLQAGAVSYDFDGVNADGLIVNGTVALNGTLNTNVVATDPAAFKITLIDNNGTGDSTTGQFTSLNGVGPALGDGDTIMIGASEYRLFYNGDDGNDVILLSTAPPAILYVDDDFTGGLGESIDGDLEQGGKQEAFFDVTAFTSVQAALDKYAGYSGTIYVNGGVYTSGIDLTTANNSTGAIAINLLSDNVNGDGAVVTVQQLNGDTGDAIDTSSGGTAVALTVEGGDFAGVISGTGSLELDDGGAANTLTLSGANVYGGTTTVTSGTLSVTNTSGSATGSGAVTVADGAFLIGTGVIQGTVDVDDGGFVSPGLNTIDDLNTGDLTLEMGSTFTAQITDTPDNDSIIVTGIVTLNNADLDLVVSATAPGAGDFILIDNDGTLDAVTGQFNGLAEGSIISLDVGGVANQLFRISYMGGDGNDVVISALGEQATTDIGVDSFGNLVIKDIDEGTFGGGTTGNSTDNWSIRVEGTEVVVNSDGAMGTLINGATQTSLNEIRIDAGLFSGDVMVLGLSGNDFITIGDLGNLVLPMGLTVDGGDGFDNIRYTGDGSVLNSGGSASFNAEEIDFFFSDLSTTDGSITLNGTGGIAEGGGTFQGVHLQRSSLDAGGTGSITLNGSGGDIGKNNQGVLLTQDSSLTTNDGDIDIDGAGGGAVAGKGVMIFSGSSIAAGGSGNLTIDGTGAAGGTIQNEGVFFTEASASVEDGDMTITGTGGGSLGYGTGVSITRTTLDALGTGSVNITGTSAATGGAINGGVVLQVVTLTTAGGAGTGEGSVTISGSGSAAGTSNNVGVKLNDTDITAGADGSIAIDGTGMGTGSGNTGLLLNADSNLTVSGSGSITLDGSGSATGTSNNDGILFSPLTNLTVADGALTLRGTGAGSGGNSEGVTTSGATLTGTGTGNIFITGSSTSGGNANRGISLTNTVVTTAASGSGSITLNGTGSASGLSRNEGVRLSNSDLATGANGAIDVDGLGGGTALGGNNSGVYFLTGSTAVAGGSGTVSIDGTGGNARLMNRGVYVHGNGSRIESGSGTITVRGTGNGSLYYNRGIEMVYANVTTAGNVTLLGTGSATSTSSRNSGVYIQGKAATAISAGGTLTITGIGGTGSALNEGVRVSGGALSATTLNLTGTASGSTTGNSNTGVYILNANLGGIGGGTIDGSGGGLTSGAGNYNHGIYMQGIVGYGGGTSGAKGFGALSLDETGNFF